MYNSVRLVSGSAQSRDFSVQEFPSKNERVRLSVVQRCSWHGHCQRGRQNKKGR